MKIRRFIAWIAASARRDPTVSVLIAANLLLPVQAWWADEPVATILIVYWLELIVIGFWTCVKLAMIDKLKALGWIPGFLMMYFVLVNLFGIIVGGTLDNEFMGTEFQSNFSLLPYLWGAGTLFVSHAVSFWTHFVRKREYETIPIEAQAGLAVMRAFPMLAAAVVGGFVGGLLNSSLLLAVVVLPMKVLLDVAAHTLAHERIDDRRTTSRAVAVRQPEFGQS